MKRLLLTLILAAIFVLSFSGYSEEIGIENEFSEPEEYVNEILNTEEPQIMEYDYEIGLDNLYKYNIVALNDAKINCHIRGSIWVGGTLEGNQYIDDGALNGVPASDSYIYNNMSLLYFKSRTRYQSAEAYYLLSYIAVENTRNFWFNLMNDLSNGDASFIYIEPDDNGHVDLKLWNYQSQGGDEVEQTIPAVYWTDAISVEMGGLAGHLIAPYADIHIVSCSHRGSIVGWNIYTDGESHINYYSFDRPEPIEKVTPTPTPTITPTPTPTPTITPTPTPTITPTPTPTPTVTPTNTPTQTPRPTVPVVRPTPGPHVVPQTGDNGFVMPLIVFVAAFIGVIIVILKRKH